MRIADKTDTRLVLVDDQADKRIALRIVGALVIAWALCMAWIGMWVALPLAALIVAGIVCYSRRSGLRSELTIDRSAKIVLLSVHDRDGQKTWDWPLSTVETAEVQTSGGRGGGDSGLHRPDLILTDRTRVPIRRYQAAGTQSWNAVAAIKLFLGQDLEDAPVGWLSPEEFDGSFKDELARQGKGG